MHASSIKIDGKINAITPVTTMHACQSPKYNKRVLKLFRLLPWAMAHACIPLHA